MTFQPGQVTNPLGRAAESKAIVEEKRFRNALLRDLAKCQGKTKIRRLDAVAKKLVDSAIEGDLTATKMIAERVDGVVPIPYQGNPNQAALASAAATPAILVVRWGVPAPVEPEADIPMLELKASPVLPKDPEPAGEPSSIKDLASD